MKAIDKKKEAQRLIDLASAREEEGDFAGALQHMENAILISPKAAILWAIKAGFLHSSQDYESAITAAKESARLNPKLYSAWVALGLSQLDLEMFDDAIHSFKNVIEIKEDFNGYTILARLVLDSDPEQAILYAQKALDLNPEWEEAIGVLARAQQAVAEQRYK